tara:strand:- start:387 stop:647 length:261 start_codon:yes stop_codon:yes gene_type:complete
MKTRITLSDLANRLSDLNELKGTPSKPYSPSNTGIKSNVGNFHLSQAYGGCNVHQMVNDGGGIKEPAGGGHVTKRECLERINSLFA